MECPPVACSISWQDGKSNVPEEKWFDDMNKGNANSFELGNAIPSGDRASFQEGLVLQVGHGVVCCKARLVKRRLR